MVIFKSFWQSSSPTNCPWHDAFPFQPKTSINKVEFINKVLTLYTLFEIFQLKFSVDADESHVTLTVPPFSNSINCGRRESGHVAFAPAFKKRPKIIFIYYNLDFFSSVSLSGFYTNTQNMSSVIKHARHRKETPLTPRKNLAPELPLHS